MSGQVNLKVSVLAVIIYSMNFLLTPTSSAAIKKENLIDTPENFKMDYSIFCNYTEFSAAFLDAMVYSETTKKAYIFKGHEVFIYLYQNMKFHFLMRKIFGRGFPNIPEAAFTYKGNIYILKDKFLYLWSEERNTLVTDHVFPISALWKNIPSEIDAVFESRNSNYIYFWKWNMRHMVYYQVDNSQGGVIKSGSFKSFFGFCSV
ncbi:Hypothetical predicted protein [Octopus vulgaris]|uniref:Uncharacterized protein n=1 Tax=Octopus vulgaris TaxID=6645 RepID=A0AA36B8Q5_OCTVU|nr:Hypothetical predicted protein [Octopus vulgaris]